MTTAEQVEKRFTLKNPPTRSEREAFHKKVADLHTELFRARFGFNYDWIQNDTAAIDKYCFVCGNRGWTEAEVLFLVRSRLESDNAQAEGPWMWFSNISNYLGGPLAADGSQKAANARQAADFARQQAEVIAEKAQRDADRKASDTEGLLEDAIAKCAQDLQLRNYIVFRRVFHRTPYHLAAIRGTSGSRKSAALRIVVKIDGNAQHATDKDAYQALVSTTWDPVNRRESVQVTYDPPLED